MKRLFYIALILCAVAVLFYACSGGGKEKDQTVISFNIDPIGKSFELNQRLAKEYSRQNDVRIELIKGPRVPTERLSQYLQFLGARSPDIDVYQIDVIWPGILADHMADMKPHLSQKEIEDFFPAVVKNNTIDGRLVCVPWFASAGLMYYRSDLLEKYGEDVPKTWDELEKTAKRIQEKERAAGNEGFWGYVWQGKAAEGLTCVGIELLESHGGGRIVERDGAVSINNPNAVRAMKRAEDWVGGISPPGVTTYGAEEARNLFQTGNALFMRNWPYAYALFDDEGSRVKDKFDVTVMPAGEEGSASALGGWQVGVSKYSKNKEEAIKFAKWITSRKIQKRRAIEATMLPARPSLYDDPEIAQSIEFIPSMRAVFENAVPRPSSTTGQDYNEVSTIFFRNFNDVLSGSLSAEKAAEKMEKELTRVLKK